MSTYTWKILSTNEQQGTMIVEYTCGDMSTSLNLPMPLEGTSVADTVDLYAPKSSWVTRVFTPVQAGDEGTGVAAAAEAPAPAQASQTPNMVGSFNEEYLRALIYQVLEEIKDATV